MDLNFSVYMNYNWDAAQRTMLDKMITCTYGMSFIHFCVPTTSHHADNDRQNRLELYVMQL
jgi:hypothetical protein